MALPCIKVAVLFLRFMVSQDGSPDDSSDYHMSRGGHHSGSIGYGSHGRGGSGGGGRFGGMGHYSSSGGRHGPQDDWHYRGRGGSYYERPARAEEEKKQYDLAMSAHPVAVRGKGPDVADPDAPCVVCYETFQSGDRCFDLRCSHSYHVDCMRKWWSRSLTCPVCREQVAPPFGKRKKQAPDGPQSRYFGAGAAPADDGGGQGDDDHGA